MMFFVMSTGTCGLAIIVCILDLNIFEDVVQNNKYRLLIHTFIDSK